MLSVVMSIIFLEFDGCDFVKTFSRIFLFVCSSSDRSWAVFSFFFCNHKRTCLVVLNSTLIILSAFPLIVCYYFWWAYANVRLSEDFCLLSSISSSTYFLTFNLFHQFFLFLKSLLKIFLDNTSFLHLCFLS